MIEISPFLILLVILNATSLLLFGVDKMKSIHGGWRIPEAHLLLMAFLGPFGGYTSMRLFKHKTRKPKFLLVPIAMFTQTVLIIYFRPI
jgi:uncharacterized membrane protein YsdA (DUF1294 family)